MSHQSMLSMLLINFWLFDENATLIETLSNSYTSFAQSLCFRNGHKIPIERYIFVIKREHGLCLSKCKNYHQNSLRLNSGQDPVATCTKI